jgi:Flp pilus assembly protein TadG
MKRFHIGERGQAMVETALFAVLAVLMAFGLLTWIPTHRARTAATAAAYACSQFLSQSPDPTRAQHNAVTVAQRILNADWSATAGVQYQVQVSAPSGPGQPGRCLVTFQAPTLFNGFLGLSASDWHSEWFISRSETWKARWR